MTRPTLWTGQAEPMPQDLTLEHPKLRRLLDFWRDHCDGLDLPLSDMLDPSDLRSWIGNLLVMDADDSGTFIYSYYGGSFAKAFHTDMVGKSIDLLPAQQRDMLHEEYDRVRRNRQPEVRRYTGDFDGVMQTWERLVLPLSTTGEAVDKILVAAYRLDEEEDDGTGV